ncbi:MAG: universal stress protein [Myxococcota bacterium]
MADPYRILVVMSTTRWSRRLGEVALREVNAATAAGRPAELDVLYVVEQAEIDRAGRAVGDSGFLGPDTQEGLVKTLLEEHRRVAARRQARVRKAVETLTCRTSWHEVTGDYEEEVRRAVADEHYDVVVLVQSRLSFLERLFYGSEDDRVAKWVRDATGSRVLVEEGV